MDREAVHWWEIMGNVRWAAGCACQGQRYLRGEVVDLELIAIARRAAEMEWEALRLIERDTTEGQVRVWLDDASGWQTLEGRIIDSVFAFDGRYGNLRRSHLTEPARCLPGRLDAVCERVVDFLAGVIGGDPLYERVRGRLADAELHRSEAIVASHRTYIHGVHEVRATLDLEVLRRALVERGMERVSRRLATGRAISGLTVTGSVFDAPEASA